MSKTDILTGIDSDSDSSVGAATPNTVDDTSTVADTTVDDTGTVASNFANIVRFHPPSNNIDADSIDRHDLLSSIDINSGLPLYRRNDLWRSWSAPPSSRPVRRAASSPAMYAEPEGLCLRCHQLHLDEYFEYRHLRNHCRAVKIESAMHRHNHTPTFFLTTKRFPNPAFLPSSTRPLQQLEMEPDDGAREHPMSDDPSRSGYSVLPAITTPKQSSEDEDEEMTGDDVSHSGQVEGATQGVGGMSFDISNVEDDVEMDLTDYDGDTEM